MGKFNLRYKRKFVLAVFAFLLLTPLIVFYSTSGDSFDTRSSAADLAELPKNIAMADLNADREVSISDYVIWLDAYNKYVQQSEYTKSCDFDNNGTIDITDLMMWQSMFETYKNWVDKRGGTEGMITYKGEEIKTLNLEKGTSAQLETSFKDKTSIAWTSKNPSAVSVDRNGKVTAKGVVGERAYIYATNGSGTEAKITITITGDAPLGKITYKGKEVRKLNLDEGTSTQLGTTYKDKDKVTWVSRNPSAVTVDNKGNITAKGKVGEMADIYAAISDTERTLQVRVTITKKSASGVISDSDGNEIKKLNLSKGNSSVLTAIFSDGSSVENWVSSDSLVASVSNLSGYGLVLAAGAGKATVTATSNTGARSSIVVTVTEDNVDSEDAIKNAAGKKVTKMSLLLNKTEQLTATFTVEKWTTNNSSVVTVDSKGLVTAKGNGEATVTAKGSGHSASVEIIVTDKNVTGKIVDSNGNEVTELSLARGKSEMLAAVFDGNTNATTSWTSSNSSAVSVSSVYGYGLVSAVGTGKATVTAKTMSGDIASLEITVIGGGTPGKITNSKGEEITELRLDPNEKVQLVATFTDGTHEAIWMSDNEDIVKVKNGLVESTEQGGHASIMAINASGEILVIEVSVVIRLDFDGPYTF